jgi:hypothetical protein
VYAVFQLEELLVTDADHEDPVDTAIPAPGYVIDAPLDTHSYPVFVALIANTYPAVDPIGIPAIVEVVGTYTIGYEDVVQDATPVPPRVAGTTLFPLNLLAFTIPESVYEMVPTGPVPPHIIVADVLVPPVIASKPTEAQLASP